MIAVVEGPSAAGKTSALRPMPPELVVGEEWDALGIPRGSGPAEPRGRAAQRFWVDLNARRWDLLLEAEAAFGRAYADTDPLKLYYNFALVAVGAVAREVFEDGFRYTRTAMAARRLGFADHVILLSAPPEVLAARRAGDATRRRLNFDLHVRLGTPMDRYYAALDRLRPGTVHHIDAGRDVQPAAVQATVRGLEAIQRERYDVELLHQLKRELDKALRAGE